MINRELAARFIAQVTQYTNYNVNIMNKQGVIIASRDPARVGQFHEIAYRITGGEADIVEITKDDNYPGVLPGINMAIKPDNQCEGVVGITGAPAEIKSVALIIKMAIEVMVKYEKQQKEQLYHTNRKEQFLYMLIDESYSHSSEVRKMAAQLNYSENYVRIPILLRAEKDSAEETLELLKAGKIHQKEDISFVLSDQEILIFKNYMPKKTIYSQSTNQKSRNIYLVCPKNHLCILEVFKTTSVSTVTHITIADGWKTAWQTKAECGFSMISVVTI